MNNDNKKKKIILIGAGDHTKRLNDLARTKEHFPDHEIIVVNEDIGEELKGGNSMVINLQQLEPLKEVELHVPPKYYEYGKRLPSKKKKRKPRKKIKKL